MKLIVLTLVFFLWSLARASETIVMEIPAPYWQTDATATFEINRETERAWVSIKAWDRSMAPRDRSYAYFRERVPGLSFDKAASTIVLNQEGAITSCANVFSRGRSIFRFDQVVPTGCQLKIKKIMKEVDTGYEIRRVEMMQVLLNVL